MRTYTLRLDEELHNRLKMHVEKQKGVTVSSYLRSIVEESIQEDFDINELRRSRRELAGIGNNMNQLAKLMHSNGIDSPIFTQLKAEVNKLQKLITRVLKK